MKITLTKKSIDGGLTFLAFTTEDATAIDIPLGATFELTVLPFPAPVPGPTPEPTPEPSPSPSPEPSPSPDIDAKLDALKTQLRTEISNAVDRAKTEVIGTIVQKLSA